MNLNDTEQARSNSFFPDDDLPEGWISANLGEGLIVDIQPGFACGENNRDGQGIAHLRPMNVDQQGKVDLSTVKYVPASKAHNEKMLLCKGDVVFNNTNSPELVGKTAFYDLPEERAFSNHMTRLRCQTEILDPHFCAMAFHQKWREGYFRSVCSHHVSQSSVGRAVLLNTPIAVPPLPEQKRIVAKVEQLLARIDVVRERLTRLREILKRFRQSVLAAACSGGLTEDWRVKKPCLEPAQYFLDQVAEKRRREYEAECKRAKEEGRRIPREPSNLKPKNVNTDGLPELPDGWVWSYLPYLGYMNRGKSQHRPRNALHLYGGPYPFIQTGDIAQAEGKIAIHRQTYSEAGLAQSRLWPASTVCITIAANIANSAILTYPACFPDSVVGVIADSDLCLAEFLEYFIRTAQGDLDQFAPATSQKNINIAILSDVAVPIPPLPEQEEIVRRVEMLFKLADAIEKRVAAAGERAERLTRAILAKAFRGELVHREAELAEREGRPYEPACALLARIKGRSKNSKFQKKRVKGACA